MTNAQIIFTEQIKLMENGTIGTTGRMITVTTADGTNKQIQEPEPIHTFAIWKEQGRMVKKGEHAKAQILIWKAKPQTVEMTDGENTITEETIKMFMKKAFFFTKDQTEPIKR